MINSKQLKISFWLAIIIVLVKIIKVLYFKTAWATSLFQSSFLMLQTGNWLLLLVLLLWYLIFLTLIFYLIFRIINFLIRKIRIAWLHD
ncbi:hypothetical protein CRI83_03080 [Liquorilactobacillus nagelii]|uniref:Uncharacterized protein n=1 Tax=Liquorilactobacillus nagelii TaxID=82688 RepID=A0A3S6R1M7_9LACO|nr:hypothetical protein BSQ50_07840 [Liquorilactobacillus nagelii]MCC7615675.1 hypothetical protein [Liquorilactobacillus nagelii]